MAASKPTPIEAGSKDAKAKDAALKAAVTQIEREFGAGSVMKLGSRHRHGRRGDPNRCALARPRARRRRRAAGRIVEIFGPESSGKTTLIYHIIAQAQARGGVCAFIDAEHAIDPIYARKIGVDTDELLISQPDYGEQALEIVDVLTRSGAVDLVAIDSVAALTPRVELEGQMGEVQVGLQARLMSQALRKLAGNLNRAKTVCLFTNQIREKIGVSFGNPETQPGGRALKFYSSQRLDLRRIETLKEGTEAVGNRRPRARSSRTRSRRPSSRPSSTSTTARASRTRAACSSSASTTTSSPSRARSSPTGRRASARAATTRRRSCARTPEMAAEIEEKIYAALGIEQAGVPKAPAAEAAPPRTLRPPSRGPRPPDRLRLRST